MSKGQFYHIMFEAPGVEPTDPELEKLLNTGLDWIRYTKNCWIVYTTSNAKRWYERLGNFTQEHKGRLFITRLDVSDRHGWMPSNLWEWLRKDRTDNSA